MNEIDAHSFCNLESAARVGYEPSDDPGVYFCYYQGRLVYVGKSARVARRLASHHVRGFEQVVMVPLPADRIDEIERAMIEALQPAWNRIGVSPDLWQDRDEARIRKPVNVTLDPETVAAFKAWCEAQSPVVQFGRALDAAMSEFLAKREPDTPSPRPGKSE